MVAGCGAEIEVDIETGRVRVMKLINAVDCGTLVNPRIVETQISGAAMMQLGFTLFEKIHLDNGQITNASLADYKIPGIADVPPMMINEAIDAFQSNAPFGAKGVGESSTMPLSPAIANALDDAVGVRLTELPITPEAVFRALREKAGAPLAAE
jgi:CO/xanthine dehydrogenase Mo-binding subunit